MNKSLLSSRRAIFTRLAASLVVASSGISMHAQAQAVAGADFPNKPIHFILPFSAGSGTDVSARYFARKLTELSGQPVIVENRSGGNGFIAVKAVTSAVPDGYTILIGSNSTLASNVALFKQLPYDPLKDLVPISGMVKAPIVLVVSGDSPFKTLRDLVEAARAKPGQRTLASGSAGYQLMGELFAAKANIKLQNVPYRGTPEVLNAAVANQVDVGIAETSSTMEFIKGGRLNALAIAADQRFSELPNVPTAIELGIAGFSADAWTAAVAPAGTPKAIVDKLASLFATVLALPETQEFAARQRMILMPVGTEEFRNMQREQIKTWRGIAASAGIELQ